MREGKGRRGKAREGEGRQGKVDHGSECHLMDTGERCGGLQSRQGKLWREMAQNPQFGYVAITSHCCANAPSRSPVVRAAGCTDACTAGAAGGAVRVAAGSNAAVVLAVAAAVVDDDGIALMVVDDGGIALMVARKLKGVA